MHICTQQGAGSQTLDVRSGWLLCRVAVFPEAAGILQDEEGVVNLVASDGLSQRLGGFWLGFLASVKF